MSADTEATKADLSYDEDFVQCPMCGGLQFLIERGSPLTIHCAACHGKPLELAPWRDSLIGGT